jgi:acetyltransferase-like isoleucine patch superfamily enzyme
MEEVLDTVLGRLRAQYHRLRGAAIDAKCNFGARVQIDRPKSVRICMRATLEADVWLKVVDCGARLEIGEYSFIGRGSEFDVSHSVTVGQHVLLGPGVFVTDHNHNFARSMRIDQQGCRSAPVIIEDDCWLGAKVVVLPGVTIHRGAVVGAGAVVTKDLPAYSISVGVPARVIADRPVSKSSNP